MAWSGPPRGIPYPATWNSGASPMSVRRPRWRVGEHWQEVIRDHFESFARDAELSAQIERDLGDFEKIKAAPGGAPLPGSGRCRPQAELIERTDLEGTTTVMVLDLPNTIRSLRPSEAEPWGKSPEELFAVGLRNVLEGEAPQYETIEAGEGLVLQTASGPSHFVADRVLDLESMPGAVGRHGSLVAIPHRHALIAYPIDGIDAVQAINILLPMALGMEQEGPGSITPNVYWYTVGRFVNLPYRIEGKSIQFMPPPDFTELLNQLAPS